MMAPGGNGVPWTGRWAWSTPFHGDMMPTIPVAALEPRTRRSSRRVTFRFRSSVQIIRCLNVARPVSGAAPAPRSTTWQWTVPRADTTLRKRQRDELARHVLTADRDHEILLAVQHVGHRSAGCASRQLHFPE